MGKSPQMEATLETITKKLFGEDRTRQPVAWEGKDGQFSTGPTPPEDAQAVLFKCPTCGTQFDPDNHFRDALSLKEFTISRMCQKCQDSVFGDE